MMTKTIYALGFFDGVHRGHAALLSAARGLARETGCRSFTLDMAMAGDSWFDAMYHNIQTLQEALQ